MNAPMKKSSAPTENYVLVSVGWNEFLAFPASIASTVLPNLVKLDRKHTDTGEEWTIDNDGPAIKLLEGDVIIAARVAAKLGK